MAFNLCRKLPSALVTRAVRDRLRELQEEIKVAVAAIVLLLKLEIRWVDDSETHSNCAVTGERPVKLLLLAISDSKGITYPWPRTVRIKPPDGISSSLRRR